MTKIAIVGTGFVADYYITTLANHPQLELAGVWDTNAQRLEQFAAFHKVRRYGSLADVLGDGEIRIVVNLTPPASHFEVNKAALDAGKHVYCEKPLALSFNEARALTALADSKGVTLCAAPANALSDAFEAFSGLLRAGRIGTPRLIYAEMEDGPVFRSNWPEWRSRSGAPWPGLHEFQIGCTIEHAGYALSWLVALFGPARHLSAFSALAFPDKGAQAKGLKLAPDFSVGCLTFANGVTARLTSGIAAPRDRSFTTVGDSGTLTLRDLWDNRSPIHLKAPDSQRTLLQKVANRAEHKLGRTLPFRLTVGRPVPYETPDSSSTLPAYPSRIDFARGIARQADALETGETPLFSGQVALHLTELVLALSAGERDYTPQTSFAFTPTWTGSNSFASA